KEKEVEAKPFVELVEQKGTEYENYKLGCMESKIDNYLSEQKIDKLLQLKNTNILSTLYVLPKYQEFLKKELKSAADNDNLKSAINILTKLKETSRHNGDLNGLLTDDQINSLYTENIGENPFLKTELI